MKAFAAYRQDCGWIPNTSVGQTPEQSEAWVNKTYVSGNARRQFKIVPVTVQKNGVIRRRSVRRK